VAQTGLDLVAEGAFGLYAPIRGARSLNGGPSFDVQLQELSAAAGARYWIPVGVRTSLHLSIVGGGQRTSSTVYPSASPDAKSSETRWGPVVRAGGGAAFYLGFGRVTAQLDYTLAPSTGIIRGNVGGAGLSLGYLASF
jgi:hypothetical protein